MIAGKVVASLDVRHADDAIRRDAVTALTASANQAGAARGVQVTALSISDEDAVATDPSLSKLLHQASVNAGYSAKTMVSGAGHDARVVAECMPIVMLFLRSPNGLSHHPDESVLIEDVEAALATSLAFMELLSTQRPRLEASKEAHA